MVLEYKEVSIYISNQESPNKPKKKRSEEVKIPVSFKKTPEELSIYNYVKDNCGMAGQSTFVKQLIMKTTKNYTAFVVNLPDKLSS